MCIHLGMSIKAEENDKVAIITDIKGPPCKAMAQGRAVVKQQPVRFWPNAFIAVNQEQPSDIFHRAHFCVALLQEKEVPEAGPSSLKLLGCLASAAWLLPSIPSSALKPRKMPPLILHSWCLFSTAQSETSRAGCAEVRPALCSQWVFKRFPRKISKCNQQTFAIYSVFNPTMCNDSWQVKWLFRVAFKPCNDNILQVCPRQKRRETVFAPTNLGGCVEKSLGKGMSNSVFVNHESTHTIHKLRTEYKWWFYYHRFCHYYSKDDTTKW